MELLDGMVPCLRETASLNPKTWGSMFRTYVHRIKEDPLLGPIVRKVGAPKDEGLLWNTDATPEDLSKWGRQAWSFCDFCINNISTENVDLPGGYDIRTHGMWQLLNRRDDRGKSDRTTADYIIPIIFWLKEEVGKGEMLEHVIERWIQRMNCIGFDKAWTENEKLAQKHLHYYLFDQGLDVAEFDSEVSIGNGRVDFVLRRGEAVPVELKLWRGEPLLATARWANQAATYRERLTVTRGYLVILNASKTERLVPGWADGEELFETSGFPMHVRLGNLAGPSPSKDKRTVRRLAPSDLGLELKVR